MKTRVKKKAALPSSWVTLGGQLDHTYTCTVQLLSSLIPLVEAAYGTRGCERVG